jgi:hypothetical protein
MKNRVVMFCTLPLVARSQKNTCFDPSGHLKNGKCIFYVETKKTLVAKVVGNTNMHISTKNGTMVPKFVVNLHKPWSSAKEDQENSCLEAPLCERVHMRTLGMACLLFFLGDASLTMTPCTVFPFF